ncbi:MAG: thioredoxin [Bacteroidales bacterium]|jgi:thioredoxin|nr:thioredoxin [Bacteroidales bacterium]
MNIFRPMNIFTLLTTLFFIACSGNNSSEQSQNLAAAKPVERATVISENEFKKLVMNFEANPEKWIYKGELPSIVDFYADWCAPCRRIAPILDELAREYAGKVNIYKVNVDHSRNLAAFFGIQSIPTMLFCPMQGLPAVQPGGMSKAQFVDAIENFLLKKE